MSQKQMKVIILYIYSSKPQTSRRRPANAIFRFILSYSSNILCVREPGVSYDEISLGPIIAKFNIDAAVSQVNVKFYYHFLSDGLTSDEIPTRLSHADVWWVWRDAGENYHLPLPTEHFMEIIIFEC